MYWSLTIIFVGMAITFPFAYAFGRRATKFMDDNPDMKVLYEFQCILIGLMGAMMWPITGVAYAVKKFMDRKEGMK